MTQKLYCYVDESGQDTEGRLFVVSVVITAQEKEKLQQQLEKIELETRKYRVKWSETSNARRTAYSKRALGLIELRGKISFALYRNTKAYLMLTAQTVARAITVSISGEYKAIVLIDALPPTHARVVSSLLHQFGIRTKKVRGVRRDESDALLRLADAVCGLARDAFEKKRGAQDFYALLEKKILLELKAEE